MYPPPKLQRNFNDNDKVTKKYSVGMVTSTYIWYNPAMRKMPTAHTVCKYLQSKQVMLSATLLLSVILLLAGCPDSGDTIATGMTPANPIDMDSDLLIDINSIERLHNVRYNLALTDGGRYKTASDTANRSGIQCGENRNTACIGYELTRNLDFNHDNSYASGAINADWRPQNSNGTVIAQADADDATNMGWEPIGSCNEDDSDANTDLCGDSDDTPFAARFEGNGYTISNLYSRRAGGVGLFGRTATNSTIRSIGVVDAALYGNQNNAVGGVVGYNSGTIVGSYATGDVNGSVHIGNEVGGLVGWNLGTIVASYATATVDGNAGGVNSAGSLVGRNFGTIIASYATGSVDGGSDNADNAGGLVGNQSNSGGIIASYATGNVTGGGAIDRIGGLVGTVQGAIVASYATGSAGMDGGHFAGSLFATTFPDTVIVGFGFGIWTGLFGRNGVSRFPNHLSGVTGVGVIGAAKLTAPGSDATTAVDAVWDQGSSNTLDAWDFGTTSQIPALRYADYDGSGTKYGCGNSRGTVATIPSIVPDGAGGTIAVICGETLLSGQR